MNAGHSSLISKFLKLLSLLLLLLGMSGKTDVTCIYRIKKGIFGPLDAELDSFLNIFLCHIT